MNHFTDRAVQYPGRVRLTPVEGEENVYDVERAEGTVTAAGTPFSAAAFNEIANTVHAYGLCTSAAGASTKVVTCPGFVLKEGATITVLFSNYQGYDGIVYMNVNGTGSKQIRSHSGYSFNSLSAWETGEAITFIYSGSYWIMVGDNRPLYVETVYLPTVSIPANAFGSLTVVPTVPTDYQLLGIVGVSLNASGALILYQRIDEDGVTVRIGCRNVTSSAVNQSGYVQVLFAPI